MAADKKISQLDAAAAIGGTELIEVVQSGVNKRTTPTDLKTGMGLANVTDKSQQFFHGFMGRTGSTLAFNNGTFTLTLAVPTSQTLYIHGVPYVLTGNLTVKLAAEAPAVGIWYITVSISAGVPVLTASQDAWDIEALTAIPCATVFWTGTAGAVMDERHGHDRNLELHKYLHLTVGARIQNDGSFSQTRPSTANDGHIELVAGTLWDEDIDNAISTAKGKLCRLWYETASGVWTFADGTDNTGYDRPFIWNAGTTRVQFPETDNSYTLADAGPSGMVPVWVYASNDVDRPLYVVTPAMAAAYNNISNARNATAPVLPFAPELKLLYRWIFRGDGEYQEAADYRTASSLPSGGVSAPVAASVTFAPSGDIAATNVQAALEELDDEKIAITDIDDVPVDGVTTAPISSNWAHDHAADDTAHGNAPIPVLSGDALTVEAGVSLAITIVDFDSYASYSVAAVEGTATIEDDIITYTGAHVGADTLTVTVNDHSRSLSITVTDTDLIATPDAPPAIGSALAGGFYTGAIWDGVCAATGELALGTGAKALTVPAGTLDFYYGQQLRIAPGPTNAGQVFMFGTVVSRADTTLNVNITSIAGSGTFSDWIIAARYKIILAPKASGENASVAYKTSDDAAPAACFTLTNGVAATAAMVAEGEAYPLAAWVNGINTGAGIGGYTDWYIPARDELALVWRNLKPVTNDNYVTADRFNAAAYTRDANLDDLTQAHGTNRHSDPEGAAYTTSVPGQTSVAVFQSGGAEAMTFGSAYYRTSSESSAANAWSQGYHASYPGGQVSSNKTHLRRARAVRRSVL